VNILDYVLLAGLAGFGIYGFIKGFFKQALVIVGLVAAFFLASKYHTSVAEMDFLSRVREQSESVATVGSFLGILFVIAALASIIATLVGRRVRELSVGAGDRWLGGFLGLVVGAVVLGGVALGLKEWAVGAIQDAPAGADGIIANSVMVDELSEVYLTVIALVPQAQRDEISRVYEERFKTPGNDDASGVPPGVVKSSDPPAPRPVLNLGAQRALVRKLTGDSAVAVPAAAAEAGKNADAVPAAAVEAKGSVNVKDVDALPAVTPESK
jgi:membrane protein required for colicin V production